MKTLKWPDSYGTLNLEQKYVFQAMIHRMMSGQNCFVTGGAGTGKSYLLDVFEDWCRLNRRTLLRAAPTGIAAARAGGITLHRMFALPMGVNSVTQISDRQRQNMRRLLIRADAIAIDEVSMARMDMFENIMLQMKEVNRMRDREGKNPVQLILCGDFAQLPPVVSERDSLLYQQLTGRSMEDGCCFRSPAWEEGDFQPFVLHSSMRQEDSRFCTMLDGIRIGVRTRLDDISAGSAPEPLKNGIWLCGTNRSADALNAAGIRDLPGETAVLRARITGNTGRIRPEQNPFAAEIRCRPGARIIMTANDSSTGQWARGSLRGRWSNGSLGTLLELRQDCALIRLDSGITTEAERLELPVYDYEVRGRQVVREKIGSIEQYPFRVGYAVTIHKSQGQTCDAVNLIPEIFAPGQLYVALSRCRTLENLYIQPDSLGRKLTPDKVRTDPSIVRFIIKQDALDVQYRDWFEKNTMLQPLEAAAP